MISKWQIIQQQDVSPSKWFPVFKHKVKLANEKIIDDFFIAPFGNVAMVLPITTHNEIVFVKQYRHGTGEILLELPAGIQQENKSIEESALAELEEETGIRTTKDRLISLGRICNSPSKIKLIAYGFLVKDVSFNSTQKLDVTEEIELVCIPPKKVLEMIRSGEICVGDTVSFIMKAQLMFPDLFR